MSAVAANPRAKSTNQAPAPRARDLADVRADLTEVNNLLATAYTAVPKGDSLDELLHHIAYDILPPAVAPLSVAQPSQADAKAAYDALFTPLACLNAATTLAASTPLHGTLAQAFVLLDNVHTELDDAGPIARALPAAAPLSKYDMPAELTSNQFEVWRARFSGAAASLQMLIHLYNHAESRGLRDVIGRDAIMGVLQHAMHLLGQLSADIREVDGLLPDDFRWRTYESHSMLVLAETIGFNENFSLDYFVDSYLVVYFTAAIDAINLANAGLSSHWEAQHA